MATSNHSDAPVESELGIRFSLFVLLAALSGLILLGCGYLAPHSQLVMGAVLLIFLFFISKLQNRIGRFGQIFLLFLAGFLTLRYWIFRTTQTLGFSDPLSFLFALLLYLAESYGILIHLFGMVVNIWPTDRKPEPLPSDPDQLPSVDIYIPTYDEPAELVRITATAATQMAYPRDKLAVYVLDDGGTRQQLANDDPQVALKARKRSEQLRTMAAEIGAIYYARDLNVHAKAGNLNEALFQCECHVDETDFDRISCLADGLGLGCGQLILVLDCDHVPTHDFLSNTVGFFIKDPKLFLVQTPHYFINPGPVEKNLAIFRKGPSENEMFYGVIQRGLDLWNASFFCGSAALLRRQPLMAAGGLAGETITEDVETSLKLHALGLNSLYLFKPMIVGLSPETYDNFIIQRSRWAQGMVQLFRLQNPLFRKGLKITQRLGYFNSCFFWFFGIARVVFFIAPMFFLLFGLRIYNASLIQVLAYGLPHLLGVYHVANQLYGRYRHPFFSEFYEAVQSIYLAPAIVKAFIWPRSPVFKVTPKAVSLKQNFLSHLALPFYVMAVICLGAQVIGWMRWHHVVNVVDALLICSLWNGFNFFLLLCCLGVVWERQQRRTAHRFPVSETAGIRRSVSAEVLPATVLDLSSGGFACRLDKQLDLTVPGHVYLMTQDSYGQRYELPAIIRHSRPVSDGLLLGCEFVTETTQQQRQVIAYVFGDSCRWRFFGEVATEPAMSTFRGLLQLLWLGLTSSLRNFKGVSQLVFTHILLRTRQALTALLKKRMDSNNEKNRFMRHHRLAVPDGAAYNDSPGASHSTQKFSGGGHHPASGDH